MKNKSVNKCLQESNDKEPKYYEGGAHFKYSDLVFLLKRISKNQYYFKAKNNSFTKYKYISKINISNCKSKNKSKLYESLSKSEYANKSISNKSKNSLLDLKKLNKNNIEKFKINIKYQPKSRNSLEKRVLYKNQKAFMNNNFDFIDNNNNYNKYNYFLLEEKIDNKSTKTQKKKK